MLHQKIGWGGSGAVLAMGATVACSAVQAQAQDSVVSQNPNILFILADDMGYGDVSILNKRDHKIKTPNIDRIANEGMIFTDAHSGSAVCTPTRYGVITGRYAWRTRLKNGVLMGYSPHLIEAGRETVASMLKKHGYRTAAFGKWHLGMDFAEKPNFRRKRDVDWSKPIKHSPISNGFDCFFGISASLDMPPYIYIENSRFVGAATEISPQQPHCRMGAIAPGFRFEEVLPTLADKTSDYILKQKKEKPFFIYLALPAPHTPVVPTKQFKGRNPLGEYAGFCEEVDWYVGQVLNALDKSGLADNTLVIFTSDNGCAPYIGVAKLENQGHYPSYVYRGYKADIFEGGHRVPFLVRWPAKVKAGGEYDKTICLTDMMATAADICSINLPDNAGEDSVSFLPALLGGKKETRQATVHHSINGSFALRQGCWKLEMCPGSGGWGYPRPREIKAKHLKLPPIQLYNLAEDPGEKHNIYAEHPEVVQRMQKLLAQYILAGRSTPGKPQQYVKPARWSQINWIDAK
jgi:arylsulfatase A-like enzyme